MTLVFADSGYWIALLDPLEAALERYADRLDQDWSLTDCASFLTMEARGIQEALAYDSDFVQAGFTALLRDSV